MTTCDYLRLASWDFQTYTNIVSSLRSRFGASWKHKRWLQYKGFLSNEGVFYGAGDQGDFKHFVISVSGAFSQEVLKFILSLDHDLSDLYCTRIDLQQTIKHPGTVLRKIYKYCPRKAKTIIESDSTTLYIGNRESDTFTRLYEKLDRKYLRLEHEFKGNRARSIFYTLVHSSSLESVLQDAFISATKKTKMGAWVTDHYDLHPGAITTIVTPQEEIDLILQRKITYLLQTESCLEKYLADHDLRKYTVQMIDRLGSYIKTLDKNDASN